ncbi:PREDICTED: uncharacterized protein LOC104808752 isoform X2 [Tarenaya hassleriana]|uniref:uncharacterized protein LOC104808752 isoform X2 n=1 Tax=Tarenaya hassleriana TaxID=28532 RepID=UPI00053C5983|nr:PREDICTED: uncharacterized protein LOC104808752 isoform X2 [Tarenaya hassleriana]
MNSSELSRESQLIPPPSPSGRRRLSGLDSGSELQFRNLGSSHFLLGLRFLEIEASSSSMVHRRGKRASRNKANVPLTRPRREGKYSDYSDANWGWEEDELREYARELRESEDHFGQSRSHQNARGVEVGSLIDQKEPDDQFRQNRGRRNMPYGGGSRLNLGGQNRFNQNPQEKKCKNQGLEMNKKFEEMDLRERYKKGSKVDKTRKSSDLRSIRESPCRGHEQIAAYREMDSKLEWGRVQKTSTDGSADSRRPRREEGYSAFPEEDENSDREEDTGEMYKDDDGAHQMEFEPKDWKGKGMMNYQEPDDHFRPNHSRSKKNHRQNQERCEKAAPSSDMKKSVPQKMRRSSYSSSKREWRKIRKASTADSMSRILPQTSPVQRQTVTGVHTSDSTRESMSPSANAGGGFDQNHNMSADRNFGDLPLSGYNVQMSSFHSNQFAPWRNMPDDPFRQEYGHESPSTFNRFRITGLTVV